MKTKYYLLILFLVLIAGFFVFWFYREGMFSKEILRLEILGSERAKTGDEIEYTVKYKNNGNFVLEQVKLVFEMPENSLIEDSKTRIVQNLEDIYPGGEEFVQFKARLLGKEGDLKVAKASISYKPKNITAPYESSTTFTTQIELTPITLDFDLPSKIEKGKQLTYKNYLPANGVYLFVVEGNLAVEGSLLERRDGIGIEGEPTLQIGSMEDSQFVIFEIPMK